MRNQLAALAALVTGAAALSAQTATPSTVVFRTNLGDITVTLLPGDAPRTVDNFLTYVRAGDYNNTIFHRSVRGFVIQGGGFKTTNNFEAVTQRDAVRNEYKVSNIRGTLAMAKLGTGPDTATNQWFFNLSDDNAANLNVQNGGFTVFGRVANDASLAILDRIAAVPVFNQSNINGAFDTMPLQNFRPTQGIQPDNLIVLRTVVTGERPVISDGAIQTAGSFGGYRYAAPGSYIEIYGSNLAPSPGRSWAASDFDGNRAPTSLDDITVTINNVAAPISFISPGQINIQIPATTRTNVQVPIVLNARGFTSSTILFPIRPLAPGLWAPPSFRVGDRQFVAAVKADGSLVARGVPNVPDNPARPGETIVFYGLGFGSVLPVSVPVAGQIASGTTELLNPVEFRFGPQVGLVSYNGLTPGQVGLYQFNVTIPPAVETGDIELTVTLNGEAIPQSLRIPIAR
jgi:uncharacterized protein (TIGR03437 family)